MASNHDMPRFAGVTNDLAVRGTGADWGRHDADAQLTRNAAVFPFINDGYPIIYQGQEHVSHLPVLLASYFQPLSKSRRDFASYRSLSSSISAPGLVNHL